VALYWVAAAGGLLAAVTIAAWRWPVQELTGEAG
jgi:hypothetical protein